MNIREYQSDLNAVKSSFTDEIKAIVMEASDVMTQSKCQIGWYQ